MYVISGIQGKTMNPSIGVCICARVNSRRLPGKVLKKVGKSRGRDVRAIEILLQHVIEGGRYPVVLAIPKNADDDRIVSTIESANIPVEIYRGEDNSPLHRIIAVAKLKGWEYVVRITADDIFIDQQLLKNQVEWTIQNNLDYSWMGRCPEGVAGEVIRTSVLEDVAKTAGPAVEFISYLLKRDGIKRAEFFPNKAFQHNFRLTLDYPEDLTLIKIVHNNLYSGYSTLDIINYLERNKWLCSINRLPRVTVYITNYNYQDHVIDAINSVLGQAFQDWELHIWDDGSADDSLKRIVTHISGLSLDIRKKTLLFSNGTNIGLPATCNKALAEARGRYILRLDADDILLPNALEEMVCFMDAQHSVGGVFANFKQIDDAGKILMDDARAGGEYKKHPGCCMLIRPLVNEIKYRDGLQYFEGDEFLSRFESLYKTAVLEKVLWAYRKHSGQKTDAVNGKARAQVRTKLEKEGVKIA
jgi:spore coat polysaccharide biosynthesis protein SpsF (cytidylyltransferase family)